MRWGNYVFFSNSGNPKQQSVVHVKAYLGHGWSDFQNFCAWVPILRVAEFNDVGFRVARPILTPVFGSFWMERPKNDIRIGLATLKPTSLNSATLKMGT